MRIVSEYDGDLKGAYNIREDGGCAARQSTENIKIESKTDLPGMDVYVKEGTKGETVFIPANMGEYTLSGKTTILRDLCRFYSGKERF